MLTLYYARDTISLARARSNVLSVGRLSYVPAAASPELTPSSRDAI